LFGREPDIQYLLGRAQAKGLTAVAGRPKMGKTWLLEEVARRLTEAGLLVGYHESTGQTSDLLLRCLSDLYTRWLSDSSYADQARILWGQNKDTIVTNFGKALGSVLASVAKPAEALSKVLDGLAVADADLKSGGLRLAPLQYEQVQDLVATLSLLSEGKPIVLILDAWEQSPGLTNEHSSLLRFLQRSDEWPQVHIFVGVRRPHHDPAGKECRAYDLCTELASSHPAAAVFDLPSMHLDQATTRTALISAIRQRVAPARGLPDDEILALVDGFPGVVERYLRRDGAPPLETKADMTKEAADAHSYRYREFDRLLPSLSPQERALCVRLALLPRMSQEYWKVLCPVVLGSLSHALLHNLNVRSVFEGAAVPSFGHDTRHVAAKRWFLDKPKYASIVMEEATYLAVELAARQDAIDDFHRPFAEALLGLKVLSDRSDAPLPLQGLPVLAQFLFDLEPSLHLPSVADALSMANRDRRLAPMLSMALLNRGVARGQRGDTEGELADYSAVIDMPEAPSKQRAEALFNRGVARGKTPDTGGGLADFSTLIAMPDVPPELRAKALVNRGATRGQTGDTEGELADYSAVIGMPEAPPGQRAKALFNRGFTRGTTGDSEGELADYSAVINMPEAPPEQRAEALVNRGKARGKMDDSKGKLADYSAVIDMSDAPPAHRAAALFNRGFTRGKTGDSEGELADYSAVIEMPAAPAEARAKALVNRGIAREWKGDTKLALADYSAVIDMSDAPPGQRAKALFNRGLTKGTRGDTEGELADYSAVINMPDAPPEQRAKALVNRGIARGQMGDTEGELADYSAVIDMQDGLPEWRDIALANKKRIARKDESL
jgi:hypothetical protein